jgi:hypothetical protein
VVRLGGSALPLLERVPHIPDPGQQVDLRTKNGAHDTGEVMIWVAPEYRTA